MSGLAGIWHPDGRPIDRAVLADMLDKAGHRGPDGRGSWIDGSIGFGHLLLCTTPGKVDDLAQPIVDAAVGLAITADVRIDNRDDILPTLHGKGCAPRSSSDAELILRAYQCWGDECPRYLIGDFVFALWDRPRRRLVCARDVMGTKPFYYVADGRGVTFASEIPQLFAEPLLAREPNLPMVGEILASAISSRTETVFRNVMCLPGAHTLTVDDAGIRLREYWSPDATRELRYRRDEEYADHFLSLFEDVLTCRVPARGPVGILVLTEYGSVATLTQKSKGSGADSKSQES